MRRNISRRTTAVLHLAWLFSAAAVAQGQPPSFSADIVSLDAGGARHVAANLQVAKPKARIEMAGAADGFFLSDTDVGTALFVRTAQRLYLDARQSTLFTRIFVPVDPLDPCRQWQAGAATAGGAGRTMGFPVKWQAADGKVFVLENIVLQAQPQSLFSIPPDYRKLDPQALLERIKHSDVWAEPSK